MYQRMKMLLGGLILSTGLIVTTPVSYAAETQVNGEEDIELAYENVDVCTCNLSITGKEATCKSFVRTRSSKSQVEYSNAIVHAFQKFKAPFSGKILHIFPEQIAVI